MKGIILAGGKGTRLYPSTKAISKQLLPIFDKPLVYYPLSILMLASIKDVLIISTPYDIGDYEKLLGDGSELGMHFEYAVQEQPKGLAEAFLIGEKFIGKDSVCLILGDNIFENPQTKPVNNVCTVFTKDVPDPERFGVWDDKNSKIVEKPKEFISNKAVVGLYYLPPKAVTLTNRIKPSARGELEITDLINLIAEDEEMRLIEVDGDWVDAGTFDSLLEAANMVAKYE